jgi:hypothetical protein
VGNGDHVGTGYKCSSNHAEDLTGTSRYWRSKE